MTTKNKLAQELKGLGQDLAEAVRQMRSSKEFKKLEKDMTVATQQIAKGLRESLGKAAHSSQAKRLKKRLGRVLEEGRKQGKVEAERAQVAAVRGVRKGRAAIQKLTRRRRGL